MARTYNWNNNPFQDYLFAQLLFDNDINGNDVEADIYIGINSILKYFLYNTNDLMYLDFDIKKKNNYFRVVCKNIVTALWLSGIFPDDGNVVINTNEFVVDNKKYKFNKKTKKLTYRIIK